MPYLDNAGLTAFWGKVKNWVAAKSASTMVKGTASTDGIPLTMSNGAETPVVLSTVKITKDDIAATGAKVTDTTYDSSTLPLNPLLSGYKTGASVHDVLKDLQGGKQDKLTDSDKQAIADLHKDKVESVNGKTGAVSLDIPTVKTDPDDHVYSINNKDIAALCDYDGNTITATYATKAALSGKQDKISDLEAIRSGAAKGATAVQTETDPTVPAWAKAASKPTYNANEIDYDESGEWSAKDIIDSKQAAISDLATIRAGAAKGATALQSYTETDPTVPDWAKAKTKPEYTAEEVFIATGQEYNGSTVTEAIYDLEDGYSSLSSSKAPIASPTLTGTPKAPTAAAGTNTTQIATCAFVSTAVANAVTGAAKYKGGITPATYAALKAYEQGWYWVVTTAGTVAGEDCEVGDMVFCNATKSGLSAPAAADFDVVQNNITAIPDSVINGLS